MGQEGLKGLETWLAELKMDQEHEREYRDIFPVGLCNIFVHKA